MGFFGDLYIIASYFDTEFYILLNYFYLWL